MFSTLRDNFASCSVLKLCLPLPFCNLSRILFPIFHAHSALYKCFAQSKQLIRFESSFLFGNYFRDFLRENYIVNRSDRIIENIQQSLIILKMFNNPLGRQSHLRTMI